MVEVKHITWYSHNFEKFNRLCGDQTNSYSHDGWYVKEYRKQLYYSDIANCETCILTAFGVHIQRLTHKAYSDLAPCNHVTYAWFQEYYLGKL